MKKHTYFIASCLILLSVIGLSGIGFAVHLPGGGGGGPPPPPPPTPKKYAAFIYATDAGVDEPGGHQTMKAEIEANIDDYIHALTLRGYDEDNIFEFQDIYSGANLNYRFSELEVVTTIDSLFIYIWGHGYYENGHSGVKLNWESSEEPFYGDPYIMEDDIFKAKLDGLNTDKIGFLVESCHSGGFVSNFVDRNYLAMSSSDEYTTAHSFWPSAEAWFSHYFWYSTELVNNAVTNFNYADAYMWYQNAKIYNGLSTYTFF